jgi:hypothetical protein
MAFIPLVSASVVNDSSYVLHASSSSTAIFRPRRDRGLSGAPQGGSVILPREAGDRLYDQCSRSTPPAATGFWQPEPHDIARLETVFLQSVAERAAALGLDLSAFSTRWRRQYVGTVHDGRRFIYGNFFPADDELPGADWRREAIKICDGGPDFFGAEFDVAARTITHLAFNGST